MKPTEALKKEHQAIKLMLKILDKVCDKLEAKKAVNQEDLNSIVEFIRTFADKCHHGKEEQRLFPMMEKYGIPREGGPIGVMIEEHKLGRNYIKNMVLA
jgi:hemerythrin-like domain-containing protein